MSDKVIKAAWRFRPDWRLDKDGVPQFRIPQHEHETQEWWDRVHPFCKVPIEMAHLVSAERFFEFLDSGVEARIYERETHDDGSVTYRIPIVLLKPKKRTEKSKRTRK